MITLPTPVFTGNIIYDGLYQNPCIDPEDYWTNYSASQMTCTSESYVNPGPYTATFTAAEGYCFEDGETTIEVWWSIQRRPITIQVLFGTSITGEMPYGDSSALGTPTLNFVEGSVLSQHQYTWQWNDELLDYYPGSYVVEPEIDLGTNYQYYYVTTLSSTLIINRLSNSLTFVSPVDNDELVLGSRGTFNVNGTYITGILFTASIPRAINIINNSYTVELANQTVILTAIVPESLLYDGAQASITVTTSNGTYPTYTNPIVFATKQYNGGPQMIFSSPGTVTAGGTMYYGFSTSSTVEPTSESSTITTVTVQNVGTYAAWFRIAATSQYSGVPWTYLRDFTITKANNVITVTSPAAQGSYPLSTYTRLAYSQSSLDAPTVTTSCSSNVAITRIGNYLYFIGNTASDASWIELHADATTNYNAATVRVVFTIETSPTGWIWVKATSYIFTQGSWKRIMPYIRNDNNEWIMTQPYIRRHISTE